MEAGFKCRRDTRLSRQSIPSHRLPRISLYLGHSPPHEPPDTHQFPPSQFSNIALPLYHSIAWQRCNDGYEHNNHRQPPVRPPPAAYALPINRTPTPTTRPSMQAIPTCVRLHQLSRRAQLTRAHQLQLTALPPCPSLRETSGDLSS